MDRTVAVDLSALALADQMHARVALREVGLDGWEVVVVSGLGRRLTQHIVAALGFGMLVDRISGVLYEEWWFINEPAKVNYAHFKPITYEGRKLTLPVALSY